MNDTGRLIAIVLIASFAIERVVAFVGFLIDRDALPPKARKQKVVLFFVAGVIAAIVIWVAEIRLLRTAQIKSPTRPTAGSAIGSARLPGLDQASDPTRSVLILR